MFSSVSLVQGVGFGRDKYFCDMSFGLWICETFTQYYIGSWVISTHIMTILRVHFGHLWADLDDLGEFLNICVC